MKDFHEGHMLNLHTIICPTSVQTVLKINKMWACQNQAVLVISYCISACGSCNIFNVNAAVMQSMVPLASCETCNPIHNFHPSVQADIKSALCSEIQYVITDRCSSNIHSPANMLVLWAWANWTLVITDFHHVYHSCNSMLLPFYLKTPP